MIQKTRNSVGLQIVGLTIVIDFAMVAVIDTLGVGSSMWWITIPTALTVAGAYMIIRGVQHLMEETDGLAMKAEAAADAQTAPTDRPAQTELQPV